MTAAGPIDLIHLEGEYNSFILRITGKQPPSFPELSPLPVLTGEFLVDTQFVRGSLKTWLFVADLEQWRDALDALDAGHDTEWRGNSEVPIYIEHDPNFARLFVTLKDDAMSMTTLTVGIPVTDSWFDEAYERLDLVWNTWLPDVDGSA